MKIKFLSMAILVFAAVSICSRAMAAEYGTDLSGYLGCTVQDVLLDFPDLYTDNDKAGSGRDFLTNGKVGFYYEFLYSENEKIEDKIIDRIVLYGSCGADFRIDQLPGGSTYGDEYLALTGMGYSFLYKTDDMRHFWMDDENHLIIVTRGPWAGASETDYSMVSQGGFWD